MGDEWLRGEKLLTDKKRVARPVLNKLIKIN